MNLDYSCTWSFKLINKKSQRTIIIANRLTSAELVFPDQQSDRNQQVLEFEIPRSRLESNAHETTAFIRYIHTHTQCHVHERTEKVETR